MVNNKYQARLKAYRLLKSGHEQFRSNLNTPPNLRFRAYLYLYGWQLAKLLASFVWTRDQHVFQTLNYCVAFASLAVLQYFHCTHSWSLFRDCTIGCIHKIQWQYMTSPHATSGAGHLTHATTCTGHMTHVTSATIPWLSKQQAILLTYSKCAADQNNTNTCFYLLPGFMFLLASWIQTINT